MSHYDDEAQAQAVKEWIRNNWRSIAMGLVLGLGGVVGWQTYQQHQKDQQSAASGMQDELADKLAAGQGDAAVAIAKKLQSDYANTPYAAEAQLRLAQEAADQQQWDKALTALDWVAANASDKALRPLAKLRAVRVLAAQNKLDEAIKRLADEDLSTFGAVTLELKGDLLLAKGLRKDARSAYALALEKTEAGAPSRSLLQQKLDDLADAA